MSAKKPYEFGGERALGRRAVDKGDPPQPRVVMHATLDVSTYVVVDLADRWAYRVTPDEHDGAASHSVCLCELTEQDLADIRAIVARRARRPV